MSKLTQCKDCGHDVSKKAKVCPSCGVSKPGVPPTDIGKLIVIAVVIFLGGVAYFNYLNRIDELVNGSQSPTPTTSAPTVSAPVPKPRVYTDAEIQEAIAKSDDYDQYRAEFTKAATFLLTTRRCGRHELKEYGGFVKAQGGYKNQPVYFTYCGGMTVSNRIYLDAVTGKVYK